MRARFTVEDTKLPQLPEGTISLNQSDTPQLFSPDTCLCLPGYSSQGPHFWVISHPPWLSCSSEEVLAWMTHVTARLADTAGEGHTGGARCKLPGLSPATLSPKLRLPPRHFLGRTLQWLSTGDLLVAHPGGTGDSTPNYPHRSWGLKTTGLEERTMNSYVR